MKRKMMAVMTSLMLLTGGCASDTISTTPQPELMPTETTTTTPALRVNEVQRGSALTLATDLIQESGPLAPQWGKDPISAHIQQETGIVLAVQYGNQDLDSQLAAMKASGEWTDLVFIRGTQDFESLCDEEYCYDIGELSAQYCPQFRESVDPMEWLGNLSPDGHIYTLMRGSTTQAALDDLNTALTVPRGLHFHETTLTKLGQDVPASIEDLEKLLYEVAGRRQELEQMAVLAARDVLELPLAEWMGIDRDVYWDEEDKSVRLPVGKDQWRDYLLMLNRWYRDGILTFDREHMGFAQSIQGMRLNLCESGYDIPVDTRELVLDRVLVEKPMTWEGEVKYDPQLVTLGADPWLYSQKSGLFITRSCSDPEKAIRLMQYMKGEEGARLIRWGIEGEYYVLDDRAPVFSVDLLADEGLVNFLLGAYSTREKINTELERDMGIGVWQLMTDGYVEGMTLASPMYVTNVNLLKAREMSARAGKVYKDYVADDWNTALGLTLPTLNTPDTYNWYERIMDIWKTGVDTVVRAETAELAEAAWSELLAQLQQENLEKLEALMTDRYGQLLPFYQAEGLLTDVQLN